LLRINEWDFRWQHVYRFSEPRVLPRGTRVSMRFTFDNSAANPRNPDRPPHRVFWGQRTADEMADVWLQLLPRVASDFELLNGAVDRKMTLEDIVGYDTMLRVDPSDADLHNDVALLHLGLGRTAKAIEHFESAARLRPSLVAAHFNLGTAYMVEGRLESAIDAYRRALDLDPRYASAHNNLASALSATGDWSGALRHYREATRLEPDNWQAQRNLMREVFAALLRSFLLPL
jgi:tetratricopeptide (TPR) repeat protein